TGLAEDRHFAVRSNHRRRVPQDALEIVFVDRMEDPLTAALLDDPEHGVGCVLDGRVEAAPFRHVAETLAGERFVPLATRELHVLRIAAAAFFPDQPNDLRANL